MSARTCINCDGAMPLGDLGTFTHYDPSDCVMLLRKRVGELARVAEAARPFAKCLMPLPCGDLCDDDAPDNPFTCLGCELSAALDALDRGAA